MSSAGRGSVRGSRRQPVLWFALLALVFAQGIGLAHAVLHPVPASAAATPADGSAVPVAHDHPHHAHALWSHDSEDSECRLYDPLFATDTPPASFVIPPAFADSDPPPAPRNMARAPSRHERPPARAPPARA